MLEVGSWLSSRTALADAERGSRDLDTEVVSAADLEHLGASVMESKVCLGSRDPGCPEYLPGACICNC